MVHLTRSAIVLLTGLGLVTACSGRGLGPGSDGAVPPDGEVTPDGTVRPDGAVPACGDGVIDPGEQCDGPHYGGVTCETLGYVGGDLACTSTCRIDTTGCIAETCGNGAVDPDEDCDGADLAGQTCASLGYVGGELACTVACHLDTTGCIAETCGDGAIDAGEDCDGGNLGGQTCVSLGFDGGDLACTVACHLDTAGCFLADCGNGALDAGEDCDGANLAGETCLSLGFDGGTLTCGASCAFDTSACTVATCGNGTLDAGEECDGFRLGGATCQTLGFDGGELACSDQCAYDTSGCVMTLCGDGLVNGLESCDGADLAGQTCESLGFAGGTLGCTDTCAWDTTGCQGACQAAGPDLACADTRTDDTGTSPDVTDVIDQWTGTGCQNWPMTGPERVYALPPAATPQTWQATLTGLSADLDLFVLRAGTDPCRADLPCVDWSYNGGNASESVSFLAEAGVAYLVVVDGYNGAESAFTLTLQCVEAEICDDGLDNDGDGAVDCADSDCVNQPGCVVRQIFEVFPYGDPGDAWDLNGVSLTFVPDAAAPNGYAWSAVDGVNAYPVTPGSTAGHTDLAFDQMNDTVEVTLPNGRSFPFYGATYTSLWVNTHGNLTFGQGDLGNQESAAALASGPPRISPCWDRYDVTQGGTVTVDRFTDKIVITWDGIPDLDTMTANQIQAELWWTGQIRLTTVVKGGSDALAGIGEGGGTTGAPEVNFLP